MASINREQLHTVVTNVKVIWSVGSIENNNPLWGSFKNKLEYIDNSAAVIRHSKMTDPSRLRRETACCSVPYCCQLQWETEAEWGSRVVRRGILSEERSIQSSIALITEYELPLSTILPWVASESAQADSRKDAALSFVHSKKSPWALLHVIKVLLRRFQWRPCRRLLRRCFFSAGVGGQASFDRSLSRTEPLWTWTKAHWP